MLVSGGGGEEEGFAPLSLILQNSILIPLRWVGGTS